MVGVGVLAGVFVGIFAGVLSGACVVSCTFVLSLLSFLSFPPQPISARATANIIITAAKYFFFTFKLFTFSL